MIKDKLILRRIAKRWCQAILLMNDITGESTCELLSEEEAQYIIEECHKIAFRIIDETPATDLDVIIKEEFDYEN
jgi:hypothetical protein